MSQKGETVAHLMVLFLHQMFFDGLVPALLYFADFSFTPTVSQCSGIKVPPTVKVMQFVVLARGHVAKARLKIKIGKSCKNCQSFSFDFWGNGF